MQWNMTGSPGLQLWLDGGMIQVGGTTAWGRLGRQMGWIFTINYEHCGVMVRATCVLHCAGVVTAMLLSHHGDGEGAAEAVHARNHNVRK